MNVKKLLGSKWTAVTPQNKEKHFTVIHTEYRRDGTVAVCRLEAALSKNASSVDYRVLNDESVWLAGWQ